MTLLRPSIVTDVFAFSKQQAIQLPFELEILLFSFWTARESSPEARLKSYVNRCHMSAGTHKFKCAVLVSGVPFQKSTLKNTNIFCRVNQADRAQKYWPASQNLGVSCPKWLSCKCALSLKPHDITISRVDFSRDCSSRIRRVVFTKNLTWLRSCVLDDPLWF